MMKVILLLSALLAVTVALPRDEQLYERNRVISQNEGDRFVDRNHKVEGIQSEEGDEDDEDEGDEDEDDEDDDRDGLIAFLMLSDSVKTTELVSKQCFCTSISLHAEDYTRTRTLFCLAEISSRDFTPRN